MPFLSGSGDFYLCLESGGALCLKIEGDLCLELEQIRNFEIRA